MQAMASSLVAKDTAAPFAGRVGLDPGGVAHFGFLSLVTDNHRQECVSQSNADAAL